MHPAPAVATRDRAIIGVRIGTVASILGAIGLTWVFGGMAEAYFSGKVPSPPKVPTVPQQPMPVQSAPKVVVKIVHHSGGRAPSGSTAPRPPSSAPGAAPPAPPPPACHSTPSKPC